MAWTVIGSMKGPPGEQGERGPEGPTGPPGAGIEIRGQVDTWEELPDDLDEEDAGAAFAVVEDGKLYIWNGVSFPAKGQGGEFRGPQGLPGAEGAKGETGATGSAGARGSRWYTGEGIPQGLVDTQGGDMYLDTENGDIYQLV